MKKIPVEGFKVADIENDAMTFGDGALIQTIRVHDAKELIAAPASLIETLNQFTTGSNFTLCKWHW